MRFDIVTLLIPVKRARQRLAGKFSVTRVGSTSPPRASAFNRAVDLSQGATGGRGFMALHRYQHNLRGNSHYFGCALW